MLILFVLFLVLIESIVVVVVQDPKLAPSPSNPPTSTPTTLAPTTLAPTTLAPTTVAPTSSPLPYYSRSVKIEGDFDDGFFGVSVAFDETGETFMVVGAPYEDTYVGNVYTFTYNGTDWERDPTSLPHTGMTGTYPQFGYAVSMSADGQYIVAGAYGDDDYQGAVWAYKRENGNWTQMGNKLVASDLVGATPYFGSYTSINANGTYMIVSADNDDSGNGAAWIFSRSGDIWQQQGLKLAPVGGAKRTGRSVSIDANGTRVAIATEDVGVYVYVRSGETWAQEGNVLVPGGFPVTFTKAGRWTTIDSTGTYLAMMVRNNTALHNLAMVFKRTGTTWAQQGDALVPVNVTLTQFYRDNCFKFNEGATRLLFGDALNNAEEGVGWVFTRDGETWTEQTVLRPSGILPGESFGSSCDMSANGQKLVLGGPRAYSYRGAIEYYY